MNDLNAQTMQTKPKFSSAKELYEYNAILYEDYLRWDQLEEHTKAFWEDFYNRRQSTLENLNEF